ncbi:MAG: peptide chain release factor 1 [Candidatus Nealsonbacteria bacterium RBG_13_36_15]|uniref:Peptide chain release factor 1 n=1 Tax=Candidatus Nealsonbacteria bacterium RBG_13_36_15 TaxID=1801660 RepID=A0A1G2DUL3_9BACT|nr:MAG: peptide chain release factor 1 [Candidatus Nealsonbacteria bacterium RBG_13_36_15]
MNLEEAQKEYDDIVEEFSDPDLVSDLEKFEELSKKKNYLEKIITKKNELRELKKKIEEDKTILKAEENPSLISLAENELSDLYNQEKKLNEELNVLLKEESEPKIGSVIIEIRAGTGGKEASLFARDLFRMYSKYASSVGWKQKVLESRLSDLGGYKEIIFLLSNNDVFSMMKYEGGVHRVQRIPETEKSGRIHTSTATVAVLPKPKKTQIKINPQDLKIDLYRASGPGGQNVNRRETAVRITHLSSGIVVASQAERNQRQNKENALAILEAKLLEQKEIAEQEKIHGKRRSQIGRAKRAEKIRTYNFPQNRLTDHRIKKSWKNLEEIFEGKLNPVIEKIKTKL